MASSEPVVSPSSRAASELGDLTASIAVHADWQAVEATAQMLANSLRNRSGPVDEHTALGKTLLPNTLTSLLKAALEGSRTPNDERASAALELLRVGANICMDHNENRGHLLEAGFPQVVVSLLEGYSESLPEIPSSQPLPLADIHLKIIKTAIGALLNLSLGYEPIQARLISLELSVTLLRLSMSIYPPGSWLTSSESESAPLSTENWLTRIGIIDWAWRTISALKDNQSEQPLFGTESLPYLVLPLKAFLPPFTTPTNSRYADEDTRLKLYVADIEALEEVAELLETVTMDIEDARLALARGMAYDEQPPCLAPMLDFIESAEYMPNWEESLATEDDINHWRRAVDICKTAVIRAIVEVSGEEENLDVLWDSAMPENGFVARLTRWLQKDHAPEDLVICAALSLGNLVRRENHAIALVEAPISITPHLVKHLTPSTDTKVKHGVIGLLKHLAQTPQNRGVFGEARVIESLRSCGVFSEKADIGEIVQMSAINLTKHLCTHNVGNSITCVLDADNDQLSTSCLSQILALSWRSDTIPVKSEGARVLVNVIKSLCSSSGDLHEPRRLAAIRAVNTPNAANTLAQLLGRSEKHTILLNESILTMHLLSFQQNGALFVLDAVVSELPKEAAPPSRQNSLNLNSTPATGNENTLATPIAGPRTALSMFVTILSNRGGKFPAEVRANLCALLGQLGRESLKNQGGGRAVEVENIREVTRAVLELAKASPDSLVLNDAARKALESW